MPSQLSEHFTNKPLDPKKNTGPSESFKSQTHIKKKVIPHSFAFIAMPDKKDIQYKKSILPVQDIPNLQNYAKHYPIVIPYYISKNLDYCEEEKSSIENNIKLYAELMGAKTIKLEEFFKDEIEKQQEFAQRTFNLIKYFDRHPTLSKGDKIANMVDLVKFYLALKGFASCDFNHKLVDITKHEESLVNSNKAIVLSYDPENDCPENKFIFCKDKEVASYFFEKGLTDIENGFNISKTVNPKSSIPQSIQVDFANFPTPRDITYSRIIPPIYQNNQCAVDKGGKSKMRQKSYENPKYEAFPKNPTVCSIL